MRSFQPKAVFMFYCTVNFLIFSKQNSFREQHICVDAIISDHRKSHDFDTIPVHFKVTRLNSNK